MGHSYTSSLVHFVFSTKGRRGLITPDVQERLWPYIAGIARKNDMKALAIGGAEDHAHVLASLPATLPVSKAIQLIKGGSSKWIRETFPACAEFAWQEGYGAFSLGVSGVDQTVAYINAQPGHHRRMTFEQEFLAFLKRHQIEYDPAHVLG